MNETKRMSSIARKISRHFWFRLLLAFFCIDLVLGSFLVYDFCLSSESQLPAGEEVADRGIQVQDGGILFYAVTSEKGEVYLFSPADTLERFRVRILILLAAEVLILLDALGGVRVVRRRMRPLNELARKAEALSSLASDTGKFSTLEQAISRIRPEAPDARIEVGDKDLHSLEVAINNLLERMREAYRQQNRFVSDASHELRTPIAVIQGYVNMLDRWGKDDPQVLQEAIDAMKNESDHMKKLVEQLLFLARGDSGRNTLNPQRFSLSELVRETGEEYEMIDASHRYLISIEADGTLTADRDMIKQSVRILVDNAVKYSPRGTFIRLGVRNEKDELIYYVQDEGIGMEPDETVHMFERFYRSDTARNSQTGGTGLGLSIAKWIVDAHRGHIEVLSRTGVGTRITVHLSGK